MKKFIVICLLLTFVITSNMFAKSICKVSAYVNNDKASLEQKVGSVFFLDILNNFLAESLKIKDEMYHRYPYIAYVDVEWHIVFQGESDEIDFGKDVNLYIKVVNKDGQRYYVHNYGTDYEYTSGEYVITGLHLAARQRMKKGRRVPADNKNAVLMWSKSMKIF